MGEFDSNPVAKSLKAYHDARARGASDGSMAGNLGVADRRSEEEKRKKALTKSSKPKSSSSTSDKKVICTELHRQGLMNRADYLLCAHHAREHLTERHFRGYHAWALPVVRRMRRSPRATVFWRVLAQARADHIAYLSGEIARRNRFGALLCAIGHPVCYVLGGFVREQGWQSLYEKAADKTLS